MTLEVTIIFLKLQFQRLNIMIIWKMGNVLHKNFLSIPNEKLEKYSGEIITSLSALIPLSHA